MSNKTFTMIVRHGSKSATTAYTLISSDYQTIKVDANTLINDLASKKYAVSNLDVQDGKLVGTNGALSRYTLIDDATGAVLGTSRAVILNRVEKNNKLVGYTVFTHTGTLAELNVADAVALCNKKLISNGKLRHIDSGDIVSAIGGNYPLRELKTSEAPKGTTTVDLLYFGSIVSADVKYFGAIVSCTSATEMSRLNSVLVDNNAKVVAKAVAVAGKDARDGLAMQRTGANSVFGVFSISILDKFIKSNAVLQNRLGNEIPVSVVKYGEDGTDEGTVKLNKQFKIVNAVQDNGSALDKKAQAYAKKLIEKFGNVKIK